MPSSCDAQQAGASQDLSGLKSKSEGKNIGLIKRHTLKTILFPYDAQYEQRVLKSGKSSPLAQILLPFFRGTT